MTRSLAVSGGTALRHLTQVVLPLWGSAGFDRTRGAFEERLGFDRRPVLGLPRRTMVQARQISVFSSAALSGRFAAGGALAAEAARNLITTALSPDGRPGWVFSVDHDGRPVELTRDLYAHAFVLFGLAWVMRIEADPAFERAVDATLSVLDQSFADPVRGGFWDELPRRDALRRQNPHMHLFEAYIALYETMGRPDILARARLLDRLAADKFLDLGKGALRELFDDEWIVRPRPGEGSVEPGHLFEWAWLFGRYQAVSGDDRGAQIAALLRLAQARGLDPRTGRVIDEIDEDGNVRRRSSRAWPHAEALKALCDELARGNVELEPTVSAILDRIMTVYCRSDLHGGWIDHVDDGDLPISKDIPASTLYHLYFGMDAVDRVNSLRA